MKRPAMTDAISAYSAPALEKGLDIIELLAERGVPMSARQIADDLGRSKSEIFRMVRVLEARDYLCRELDGDALMLSNKLFGLGMKTARARALVTIAAPIIDRFADDVGQAAHLVVAHRCETVVIIASSGSADMNFSLKLGYRRPLADAHSGLVLMAFQTPQLRQTMIDESLGLMHIPPDRAHLTAELDAVHKAGSLVRQSRDILGITDLCCPVLLDAQRAIACVTVAAVARHEKATDLDAVLARQKQVCAQIAVQFEPQAISLYDAVI